MNLTTSGVWTMYGVTWLLLCILLVPWHIFSYVRVSVASISRAVPFTILGALIGMMATGFALLALDIHNALVIGLIILPGYWLATIVSVSMHDHWPRRRRRHEANIERAANADESRKHAWNQAMVKRRKQKDFTRATLER